MRSRRIPATQTTPSIPPNVSTAVWTMRRPPSIVVTVSATATAEPPAAVISATTASATSLLGSVAVDAHAEVVDDDVRAGRGARQRNRAADARGLRR